MAPDPYKYFRVEARELLDQFGKGLLELERGAPAGETVQRLLRFAHTLKGAARVVKQAEIAERAHAIEDALAGFRDSSAPLPRDRIETVLGLLAEMGTRVTALSAPVSVAGTEARKAPEDSFRSVRADVEEMDALIDGTTEAHVQLAALRRALAPLDELRQLHEQLADQLRPRRGGRGDAANPKSLALAEELGGLLGTLQRSVGTGVEQLDRELRQVREAASRLRLLPVGLMFDVLERTARDTAKQVGKGVVFQTHGGDVRLDAHVLGLIQSAFVQIVRNAVAHGIETPSERRDAGKPADGRITLRVTRKNSRVSFSCHDDGRGVDVDAIRLAAQRKGLVAPEAKALRPEELLKLMLQGGITTSDTVTDASGRGIGLDVVREAVARLGGEVSVQTEARRGTTLELLVPVSLTSLEGLRVEAGAQEVVIPLDSVSLTLRLGAADIARAPGGDSIVLEGRVIPFAPLALSLKATVRPPKSRREWSAVVVHSGGALAALGVDRLLGTENVVLRPLPRLVPAEPVVAGAALDREGNPQLVLNPEALVAEAARPHAERTLVAAQGAPILVVDDSLTTRMLEQAILESAGYEVVTASSAEEGLLKVRRQRFSLCLVDVEMPGMDGFAFIRCLRADAALMSIPAILVTSRNAPEDKERGKAVGAQGYVVKSEFNQTQLLDWISRLVGKSDA